MYKIPLTQYPYFTQETTLDKVLLVLTFLWSYRNSAWYVTMGDRFGNVILYNVKLVNGVNLLDGHNRDNLPKGILICFMLNNDTSVRLPYDITQFELQYITEAERAAL